MRDEQIYIKKLKHIKKQKSGRRGGRFLTGGPSSPPVERRHPPHFSVF